MLVPGSSPSIRRTRSNSRSASSVRFWARAIRPRTYGRLRRVGQQTSGLGRLAIGSRQVLTVEKREAQVEARDAEAAIDLQRVTESRGGWRILEPLEQGDAAVVGVVGTLTQVRGGWPAPACRENNHKDTKDTKGQKTPSRPVRYVPVDGLAADGDGRRAHDAFSFFNRQHLVRLLAGGGVDTSARPGHADGVDARRRAEAERERQFALRRDSSNRS